MKDPAFLLYYENFIVGIQGFTDQEVGAYFRLLLRQADKGHMTTEDMKNVCQTYDTSWPKISSKFKIDAEGKFYNKRLQDEIEKRASYCNSRRKNREHMNKICKTYVPHMEDANANEDEDAIKDKITDRIEAFRTSLLIYKSEYGEEMIEAFFLYWSEKNPSGKKMRFELQKTWETPRRLKTWANREKVQGKQYKQKWGHQTVTDDDIREQAEYLKKKGVI